MTGKLEGRAALVTGAGRNIGRAIALRFAAEGADVVINARSNAAEANAVAEEARGLGVRALPLLADVADADQVEAMAAAALSEFGRIDILVSNAAIRPSKPFHEITRKDWERVRGVVLDGAFYCARAVVPSMLERGSGCMVFMIGDGAFTGASPRAHVSAAKMGLAGLTRSLARELGPSGIRVNAISPGIIDTTRDESWYRSGFGSNPGGPLGRSGTVDEIADAALYLVSSESSFVTGQTLHVNGGGGMLS